MSVRNGLLALLVDGNRHGYELRKELEARTGSLWELNVGQIYTTLSRLERDGYVTEVEPPHGSDAPDAQGSTDQRRYALTDAGHRELVEWYREPRHRSAPGRDELVIKVTLAAQSDDVDLHEVIDSQRMVSTEELQRYTRAKARTDENDTTRLMALDAVIAQIDAELRWLEQCRRRHEESRSAPGPGAAPPNALRTRVTRTRRGGDG